MKINNKLIFGLLCCAALVIGGCIVSGTFVVVESFEFTTQSGYYLKAVDLTDNEDWEDHRENIDEIDVVGFELWITNNEPTEWKFWAYMDDYEEACTTLTCANGSSTKFLIFDTLTVPAASSSSSTKFVSYAESFNYIQNLDKIKAMVKSGQFNYFGFANGGGGGLGGQVDSIRVIITVNASDT